MILLHSWKHYSTIYFALTLVFAAAMDAGAEKLKLPVSGKDALTGKSVVVGAKNKKGLAVIFLSAECPCSNSHVGELAKLASDYPNVQFVAVNSNASESDAEVQAYFRKVALPFPVLRDPGQKLADALKAAKTPHAFLLSPSGDVLFNGGVSNSEDFKRASKNYLRDALSEMEAGKKKLSVASARTLGCAISRAGGSHSH